MGGKRFWVSPPDPSRMGGMRKFPPQTSPEWGGNNLNFPFKISLYTKIFAACGGHIPKFSSPAAGSHTINYTKSFFRHLWRQLFLFIVSGSKSGRLRRNTTNILRQLKMLCWNWRKTTIKHRRRSEFESLWWQDHIYNAIQQLSYVSLSWIDAKG